MHHSVEDCEIKVHGHVQSNHVNLINLKINFSFKNLLI